MADAMQDGIGGAVDGAESVGARIRAARLARGMTQADLAAAVGSRAAPSRSGRPSAAARCAAT